jgi:glycosyltransferase involved in cell wall biosynthesis
VGTGDVRCLWLSRDVPYPALSGRRVYTAGLTEALAEAGVDVHGLGLDDDTDHEVRTRARWVAAGRAAPVSAGRRLLSRWPAMAVNCMTPAYRRALGAALQQQRWDVAVVDHLQMAWAMTGVEAAGVPLVYVSNNHEASTRRSIARHRPWYDPTKLPLAFDAWRAEAAELQLENRSQLVTAITEVDAQAHRAAGATNVIVLPPGHARAMQVPPATSRQRVAVVLTNLDWHVKRTNLLDFLRVGDQVLAAADVELRIVGPAPREFVERQAGAWRSARFVGAVEDVVTELAHASVGVVSEREGGGFKLKTLDYIFSDVPMAVLEGSVAGLPLRPGTDFAVATSELALAHEIVRLVDAAADERTRMATTARERCRTEFSWSSRGVTLAAALRSVADRRPRSAV